MTEAAKEWSWRSRARVEPLLWWGGGLLLVLTSLAWLLPWPYPPLQDFVEWIYQGSLFAGLLSGDKAVTSAFTVVGYPIPNSISQIGMGLMMLVWPPMAVGRMWLCLYLASFVTVGWFAMRKLRADVGAAMFVVLLGAAALNACFWSGYINFQIAVLLLAAFFVVHELYGKRSAWLIALFGVGIFFAHAAIFAAFVMWVGLRDVLWRRDPRAAVALVPSLALLAWYILARSPEIEPRPPLPYDNLLQFLFYKAYTFMKLGPFHNFVAEDGASWAVRNPLLYKVGVGANLVFAAFLGLTILMSYVDTVRTRQFDADRMTALLPPLALFAAFAVAPAWLPGVVNIGERFLIAAVVMILLTAPLRPWLVRAAAAAALTAIPLNAAFWFSSEPPPPGRAVEVDATPGKYGLFAQRPYAFDDKAQAVIRHGQPELGFRTSLIFPKAPAAAAPNAP